MEPIRIPGLPEHEAFADPSLRDRVMEAVKVTESRAASRDPAVRAGADLRFDLAQANGEYKRYELIGGGAFLRDPLTRAIWPFPPGRQMLEDILPRLARLDDADDRDLDPDSRTEGGGPR